MVDKRRSDQNNILVALSSNPDIAAGRLEPALRKIAEVCAKSLEVDRITIWGPSQSESDFYCFEAYDRIQKGHSQGEKLVINQYPNFFAALMDERVISFRELASDLRTSEVYNQYWKNYHIVSSICVPLRIHGRIDGFVSFEKTKMARDWQVEEEAFACQVADLIVNTWLSNQSRELTEQLDIYEATLHNITRMADSEAALHELIGYAVQMLDCDCGLLFINDARRQECYCSVSYNAPANYTGLVLGYGEDIAGTVVETGRAMLVQNFSEWSGRSQKLDGMEFSGALAVPLRIGDRSTGAIELMRKDMGQPFLDWDRKMLEMLGKQISVVLEQTQLEQKRVKDEGHRRAIHQMVETVSQSNDLSLMVQSSLDLILECMAVSKGSVRVRPLIASRNLSEDDELQITRILDRDGHGFTNTIPVEDWADYSGALFELAPLMNKLEIRASMFVPIMVGEACIGSITFHSPVARHWSEEGIHQIQTMAKLMAITADKLTSHRYLDTHTRLMGKLNSLNRGLNRLFTFEEAVDRVGSGVVNLLDSDQGAVFLRNPDGSIQVSWTQEIPEAQLERAIRSEGSELAKMIMGFTSPVIVPKVKSSSLPGQFKKLLVSEGIKTMITLPLIFSGQIIGAVSGFHKTARELSALERSVLEAFTNQAAISMQNAWMHGQMEQGYTDVALALARAMDARDSSITDASLQIAAWAEETGNQLGLTEQEIRDLHWAALLHNIGKVSVPNEVLQKPGTLDEDEWRVVRQYPVKGEELIQPLSQFRNVGQIIRHSRERYDGNGYPDRRKGEDIPLAARVLSVADAYNSMTENRPYRSARSPEEAISELERGSGTQFDPKVVSVFVETIQKQNGKHRDLTGHQN